jgi:hypothetical protein
MKKIVLMILVIIFCVEILFSSNRDMYLRAYYEEENFTVKGNFRKCTLIEYYCDSHSLRKKSIHIFKFDINGNLNQRIAFKDASKDTLNILNIIYNKDGNFLKQTTCSTNGRIFTTWIYQYDERKNLIEKTEYESDTALWSKSTYKYDSNNIQIRHTRTNFPIKGREASSISYLSIFDASGNKIEEKCYRNDALYSRTIFKYDEYKNVIESINIDNGNRYYGKTTYKYDENKNIIEEINFNNDNTIYDRYKYQYESSGRLVEMKRFFPGMDEEGQSIMRIYKTTYEYDKYGNLKEEINFDEFNKPQYKTVYKYSK